MLIDNESVVLGLKAEIRSKSREGKRSWGASELLELLTDLEVKHRVPEGQEGFSDEPMYRRSDSASLDEPVAVSASGAS